MNEHIHAAIDTVTSHNNALTRTNDELRARLAFATQVELNLIADLATRGDAIETLRAQRAAALAQAQTLANLVNVYGELGEDELTRWIADLLRALGATDA